MNIFLIIIQHSIKIGKSCQKKIKTGAILQKKIKIRWYSNMITITNLRNKDLANGTFDEVWAIVRSAKKNRYKQIYSRTCT